jgi:hypothetical protein
MLSQLCLVLSASISVCLYSRKAMVVHEHSVQKQYMFSGISYLNLSLHMMGGESRRTLQSALA